MIRLHGLKAYLGLALVLAMVAAACGGQSAPTVAPAAAEPTPTGAGTAAAASSLPEPTPTVESAEDSQATPVAAVKPLLPTGRTDDDMLAPPLGGINSWINSEPFTLEEQRGNVVLVDFWTYTCINCIRTFPFLREWHEKYADQGLVILGVHAPEFEFEKKRDNVIEAVNSFGLKYPVAQDNEHVTWRNFKNQFWPAKYLIDRDGYIRYTHFGEGAYTETEEKIRELLAETGASVASIELNIEAEARIDPRARSRDPDTRLTRELYAGYERNYSTLRFGSVPPYVQHKAFYDEPDRDYLYVDPGGHLNQFLYLKGLWYNGPESITHARKTEGYEDYLAINFSARTVNVVMSPEDGEPYRVRVTFDDMPLHTIEAGEDIEFDEDGNSYVLVDEARMYFVIKLPEFDSRELKLSSNSSDFSVFAYTFGAYEATPE